jgi:hypothetical protein
MQVATWASGQRSEWGVFQGRQALEDACQASRPQGFGKQGLAHQQTRRLAGLRHVVRRGGDQSQLGG